MVEDVGAGQAQGAPGREGQAGPALSPLGAPTGLAECQAHVGRDHHAPGTNHLALSLTCQETLVTTSLLSASISLLARGDNSTPLVGLSGLTELKHVKCSEQCLAFSRYSVDTNNYLLKSSNGNHTVPEKGVPGTGLRIAGTQ